MSQNKIKSIINQIILSYNNLENIILNMIRLNNYITKNIDPSKLSFVLLDFMCDEGMWNWVYSFDKNNVTNYDFEAGFIIIKSLNEIKKENILCQTI